MTKKRTRSIAEIMADGPVIDAAVQRAVYNALVESARAGADVVASVNGQIVWRPAAEILAERTPPSSE